MIDYGHKQLVKKCSGHKTKIQYVVRNHKLSSITSIKPMILKQIHCIMNTITFNQNNNIKYKYTIIHKYELVGLFFLVDINIGS